MGKRQWVQYVAGFSRVRGAHSFSEERVREAPRLGTSLALDVASGSSLLLDAGP